MCRGDAGDTPKKASENEVETIQVCDSQLGSLTSGWELNIKVNKLGSTSFELR